RRRIVPEEARGARDGRAAQLRVLRRRGPGGRAPAALRGRRRVRDALPEPLPRPGGRGVGRGVPGGCGVRQAGRRRRLRRRRGGGGRRRDRTRRGRPPPRPGRRSRGRPPRRPPARGPHGEGRTSPRRTRILLAGDRRTVGGMAARGSKIAPSGTGPGLRTRGAPMPGDTLTKRFREQVSTMGDRDAMHFREGGEWRAISWNDYGRLVRETALGLAALGVEPGDAACILSTNRPDWHVADLGGMSAGAITVPVYPTNSPEQVAYIAGHSEATVIFVENEEQLRKV